MSSWRLDHTAGLERWDTDRIIAALADDVVIRVAVHDAPMHGEDIARFLVGVLSEEPGTLEHTGEIVEGQRAVILFQHLDRRPSRSRPQRHRARRHRADA